MKNKHVIKRSLSMLCALALLLGMVVIPNNTVSAAQTDNYREVTFTDFGMIDQTVSSGSQIKGTLNGATSLDGVAFSGKIKMDKQSDMYHTLRIGGREGDDNAQWSGIGMWPEATTHISFYHYTGVITGAGGVGNIVQVPIADYGITYDATNETYSEFNLRMAFHYVPNTKNVELTIHLNDRQCYNGILEGLQDTLGTRLHLWATGGKTIGIKSAQEDYREVTFSDFGVDDQTIAVGGQVSGDLTSAKSLNGIAFNGKIQMGKGTTSLGQSFRMGGSASNTLVGVGFWPEASTQIAWQNYTGDVTGPDLTKMVIANHGVTYTEGTGFSEFTMRLAFRNIPNTRNMKLTIFINGKMFYTGVLTDAQDNFGTKMFLWAQHAPITVKSVELEEETYKEVTFSDFGVDDQTVAVSGQVDGDYTAAETLDGLEFVGKIQMGKGTTSLGQSFRIGGSDSNKLVGIGFWPEAPTQIAVQNYTGDVTGPDLAKLAIADYGITYDSASGQYSEFELRMAFKYLRGSKDILLTMKINDKDFYEGILEGAQDTFGTKMFLWAQHAPITVKSAGSNVKKEYKELTFADFNLGDQKVVSDAQMKGTLQVGTSLDGIALSGKVTMGLQADMYYSLRVGGREGDDNAQWSGIGLWPEAATQLALFQFNAVNTAGGADLAKIPIADYGITYDAETGYFSEFDYRMTFEYVTGTKDVKVTVSVNDKECYNGVITNGQETLGTRIHIWARNGKTITIKSAGDRVAEEASYTNVTLSDFGVEDTTLQPGYQAQGALTAATLDGVAFESKVQFGVNGSTVYQSFRVGATASKVTSGVGLFVNGADQLSLYHFSGDNTGRELAKLKLSDFDMTADTSGFSEATVRMAFKYIPNTKDVKVNVSVNGKHLYSGILFGAQDTLGNRLFVWAYNAPLSIKSVGGQPTEPTYEELTFVDFGIGDQVVAPGVQVKDTLKTGDTLDGVAISGSVKMGYQDYNRQSIRIGGYGTTDATQWSGIGFYTGSTGATKELVLRNWNGVDTGTALVRIALDSNGITYDSAAGTYAFDMRVAFRYVENTADVHLTVSINGNEIYDDVVSGLQNALGTRLHVWANGAPITISSAGDRLAEEASYTELTFTDFGVEDGTRQAGMQAQGALPSDTMDGVAINGKVTFGDATSIYQSFRIGGTSAKVTSGVGIYPSSTSRFILRHYSGDQTGTELCAFDIANYGITYTAGTGFSEADVRMAFKYIPNTKDVKLNVFVNDKHVYSGILYGAQDTLGNRLFVWAYNAPITIQSVGGQSSEPVTFREVTFRDFGINDQNLASGAQVKGKLLEGTTLDGVAFTGKISMGLAPNMRQSLRIGGREGDDNAQWSGIGLWTEAKTQLAVYQYTSVLSGAGGMGDVAKINPADYGITYDEATNMFSEFTYRVTFAFVENSKDVKMTISLNDKECFNGVVSNGQDTLGTRLHVWAQDAEITIGSVGEAPTDPTVYTDVTFYDFGILDQNVGDQLDGDLKNYTSMDGLAFNGRIKMALAADDHYQTVRIGTTDGGDGRTNGIGIYTASADTLMLYNFTTAYWGTALKELKIADYGITYDEATNMFSEFKLRMAFKFVGEEDVMLTVSINDIECYQGVVAGLQKTIGIHLFAWGRAAMSLRSYPDGICPVEKVDPAPVITSEFKKISFADYGFEAGTYGDPDKPLYGHCRLNSLDKVVFCDTVNFSEATGAQWRFGGPDSIWEGIMITATPSGWLKLTNTVNGMWLPISFDPQTAGCELVGTDVEIQMSFEYVDSDNDGEKDDVKLGVWFNGKPYANRCYYLTDKAPELGGFTMLYTTSKESSITINPYYESVDFTEFGFTVNWAVELGLKKKK